MNNKGSLAGLREACQREIEARVAGMSDKQKLQAWNRARNIATTTLKQSRGDTMNKEAIRLFFIIMEIAQHVHNANMRGDKVQLESLQGFAQEIKEKAQEILDL